MIYLRAHTPTRSQFRSPRRAKPSGAVVLHTAESILDSIGPDTGAENVAAYIVSRDTPGSYHDIVDADSRVQLVDYGDEAYQDVTGSNPWALSISFACRTSDWERMSPRTRAGFMQQGALAFAAQQAWLRANGHPVTEFRRLRKVESDLRIPGFITHADRDPARRTDPGREFPWNEFWAACRQVVTPPAHKPPEGFTVTDEERLILRRDMLEQANKAVAPVLAALRSTLDSRKIAAALAIALEANPDATVDVDELARAIVVELGKS